MENQVIVIGGGPAGMMAALTAAKTGAKVYLWERNDCLGKKLSITGKGRCNITNNATREELIKNLPGNGAFLHSALSRFPAQATMDFFADLGVELPLRSQHGGDGPNASCRDIGLFATLCGRDWVQAPAKPLRPLRQGAGRA